MPGIDPQVPFKGTYEELLYLDNLGLSQLADLTLTDPTNGDTIVFEDGVWINVPDPVVEFDGGTVANATEFLDDVTILGDLIATLPAHASTHEAGGGDAITNLGPLNAPLTLTDGSFTRAKLDRGGDGLTLYDPDGVQSAQLLDGVLTLSIGDGLGGGPFILGSWSASGGISLLDDAGITPRATLVRDGSGLTLYDAAGNIGINLSGGVGLIVFGDDDNARSELLIDGDAGVVRLSDTNQKIRIVLNAADVGLYMGDATETQRVTLMDDGSGLTLYDAAGDESGLFGEDPVTPGLVIQRHDDSDTLRVDIHYNDGLSTVDLYDASAKLRAHEALYDNGGPFAWEIAINDSSEVLNAHLEIEEGEGLSFFNYDTDGTTILSEFVVQPTAITLSIGPLSASNLILDDAFPQLIFTKGGFQRVYLDGYGGGFALKDATGTPYHTVNETAVALYAAAGLGAGARPAVPTQVVAVDVDDFNAIRTAMIALGIWTDGD